MPQATDPLIPIDIPIETLVGCIDILEANGQPTSNKTFSSIIQELLSALLLSYQKEGVVPIYENTNILAQRFLDIVDHMSTLSKTDKDYISDSKVDEIIEDSKKELEEESKKELESTRVPLEPIKEDAESKNDSNGSNIIEFSMIPDNDSLKKDAKSPLQQSTLCLVYSQISRELWGSETARTLWVQVIGQKTKQVKSSPESND